MGRVEKNDRKFASKVEEEGSSFIPLAVETLRLGAPHAKMLGQIAGRPCTVGSLLLMQPET